jgi:hypothetical protein
MARTRRVAPRSGTVFAVGSLGGLINRLTPADQDHVIDPRFADRVHLPVSSRRIVTPGSESS